MKHSTVPPRIFSSINLYIDITNAELEEICLMTLYRQRLEEIPTKIRGQLNSSPLIYRRALNCCN